MDHTVGARTVARGGARPGLVRRTARSLLALGLAVPLIAGPAFGKDPKDARPPAPPRRLDAALAASLPSAVEAASGGAFWGVVLVARGGEVVFEKGWGTSDRAGKRPNDARTIFELASTSKQVAATAILRLEQQKKLKTSDPITKFFPKAPKDKKAVTVDHLLHHTAGLDPNLGVPYAWKGTLETYLETVLAPPLETPPGTAFAYSNVGYALLAAIVEVVTGASFEAYCRKELFAPAGLVDTGFVNDGARIASDRAARRACDDCLDEWTATNWWYGWGYRGMGGVVSTADDLVRWDRALRGDAVLDKAAKAKLHTPALDGYACGWFVGPTDTGTTRTWHTGGVRGFAIQYVRWLEDDVMLAILSDGKSNLFAVERAVTDKLFAPPKVVADLDATGFEVSEYRAVVATEGVVWVVERDKATLTIRLRRGDRDLAVLRAPRAVTARLATELEQALASSRYEPKDEPAAMEAGVYFGVLGGTGVKAHVEEDLALRVLPSYRGQTPAGEPVEDPRAVFVLDWAGRGWPVMVKMNPMATQALLDAIRKG